MTCAMSHHGATKAGDWFPKDRLGGMVCRKLSSLRRYPPYRSLESLGVNERLAGANEGGGTL